MSNEPSRRLFLRNVTLGSMAVGSGLPLAACGGDDDAPAPTAPVVSYQHGVASGDPLADRVMLWTRVTPAADGTIAVQWEVASDEAFTKVVKSGSAANPLDTPGLANFAAAMLELTLTPEGMMARSPIGTSAGPNYFSVAGTRILAGSDFSATDIDRPVVAVSAALVKSNACLARSKRRANRWFC